MDATYFYNEVLRLKKTRRSYEVSELLTKQDGLLTGGNDAVWDGIIKAHPEAWLYLPESVKKPERLKLFLDNFNFDYFDDDTGDMLKPYLNDELVDYGLSKSCELIFHLPDHYYNRTFIMSYLDKCANGIYTLNHSVFFDFNGEHPSPIHNIIPFDKLPVDKQVIFCQQDPQCAEFIKCPRAASQIFRHAPEAFPFAPIDFVTPVDTSRWLSKVSNDNVKELVIRLPYYDEKGIDRLGLDNLLIAVTRTGHANKLYDSLSDTHKTPSLMKRMASAPLYCASLVTELLEKEIEFDWLLMLHTSNYNRICLQRFINHVGISNAIHKLEGELGSSTEINIPKLTKLIAKETGMTLRNPEELSHDSSEGDNSTSLHQFASDERKRLEQFVTWYETMSKMEPEKFPITLPSDNEGAWFEMLMDFDPDSDFYQLQSKGD
jgi:hypothetical protein